MSEPHEQVKNGHVMKFVKDYWFLLVFIVGSSIAFAEIRAQVLANEQVNMTQQVLIDQTAGAVNSLEKKYIEDITFIKTTLEQLSP